jgi:uncharacterized membrane protein
VAVTRRCFVAVAAGALAALARAAPAWAQRFLSANPNDPKGRRKIYRLSSRGRRHVGRKTKAYHANMRFATKEAADRHRAHRFDTARIVATDISVEKYVELFVKPHTHVIDLRTLGK